jgi:hypothetical protein
LNPHGDSISNMFPNRLNFVWGADLLAMASRCMHSVRFDDAGIRLPSGKAGRKEILNFNRPPASQNQVRQDFGWVLRGLCVGSDRALPGFGRHPQSPPEILLDQCVPHRGAG